MMNKNEVHILYEDCYKNEKPSETHILYTECYENKEKGENDES